MRITRRFTSEGHSPYAGIAFRSQASEIRNPVLAELGELHKGRKAVQPNGRTIREFYREATPLLKHPVLMLDSTQREEVGISFQQVIAERGYTCYACAVMPDHVHILIRKHKYDGVEIAEHLMTASRTRLVGLSRRGRLLLRWISSRACTLSLRRSRMADFTRSGARFPSGSISLRTTCHISSTSAPRRASLGRRSRFRNWMCRMG